MNAVVWIASGVLAAVFALAGVMKVSRSKAQIVANPSMAWATGFSPGMIRFIGVVEIAGALGLILPGAVDVATWLVPAAAIGLAVLMIGAAITHERRKEFSNVVVNVVLLAVAVFVAVERLGPHRF